MRINYIISFFAVLIFALVAFFVFFRPVTESLPPPAPTVPSEPAGEPEPASVSEPSPAPIVPSPPAPTVPSEPAGEPEDIVVEPEPPVVKAREPRELIIDIYSFEDWRPSSLTIHIGDTITFINHDSNLHWPGADPHPTHSSLPPFDALGGISKGQSYSYTFHKPGVYGHHDHLLEFPPTLGTITVLEDGE